MEKLCLSTRDELVIIDLKKIAYFQADSNYTLMTYIQGETRLLTIGLSNLESYIRKAWPQEIPTIFVRLGRSLIINQTYLREINVVRQRLVLSDSEGHTYTITVSKNILKEYKNRVSDLYLLSNDKKEQ